MNFLKVLTTHILNENEEKKIYQCIRGVVFQIYG
jgi:hemerythrin superfamily protein